MNIKYKTLYKLFCFLYIFKNLLLIYWLTLLLVITCHRVLQASRACYSIKLSIYETVNNA